MPRPPDPIWQAALEELSRRTAALRTRTFQQLAELPEAHIDATTLNGAPINYTTYRVTQPAGHVQVVVQVSREGRRFWQFQLGQSFAEGFWMTPDGQLRILSEEELWSDYL